VAQGQQLAQEYVVFSLALFSSEIFLDFGTVVFSFLFDKYYPIID